MKRRIAILALGLIASPLAMLATPVQAADVCAGTGVLNTPKLEYIVIGTPNSGPISGELGLCVSDLGPAEIGGSVSGGCGQSSGTVTVNGSAAGFTTAASIVVVIPGAVAGVANAIPAVGQSCLPGAGATNFQVTGAVAVL